MLLVFRFTLITNKTDLNGITEILLKVALNTITPIWEQYMKIYRNMFILIKQYNSKYWYICVTFDLKQWNFRPIVEHEHQYIIYNNNNITSVLWTELWSNTGWSTCVFNTCWLVNTEKKDMRHVKWPEIPVKVNIHIHGLM